MINLKQPTIDRIKAANTDQEVEKVIYDSLIQLQNKEVNSPPIKNYIGGMIVSLLDVKNESISLSSRQNIVRAIEIFKKLV